MLVKLIGKIMSYVEILKYFKQFVILYNGGSIPSLPTILQSGSSVG